MRDGRTIWAIRTLCCAAVGWWCWSGVGPAKAEPATTQPATTQPATTQPAAAPPAESAAMTVERRLLERIEQLLAAGEPELPEAAIRKRLEQVIRNAGQLADRAESGPLRLKAMNLQAQAIHARLAGHSDPEEFDRLRHRLRLVALRTKAMSEPAAAAVGDFWRVAAELIELNRTGLPGDVRESHASDVLQDYVNRYPEGPAAPAARAALARLRGDEPVASSATQPATRPATPPTTQPAAQPAVEPAAATTQPAH